MLLRRDGAALLQHRDDKPELRHAGMWVLPGGHAESDESMLDGARRELREETEYDASDLRFLLTIDDTVEGWPAYRLMIFCRWYDGIQPVVCHEGQALAVSDRTMAANYAIPAHLLNAWDTVVAVGGATTES
jgi:8-oxo-dGTP pyrophosphatase MutT (NUDIX family)